MPKLNDSQLVLLAAAAQRDARNIYPLPDALAGGGDRAAKAIAALIKHGLAEDRETTDHSHAHRTDGDLHGGTSSGGLRVPAIEIERTVRDQTGRLFDDGLALASAGWLDVAPVDFALLIERCGDIEGRSRAMVHEVVQQVRVHGSRIEIDCSTAAIAAALGVQRSRRAPDTITLAPEITLTRSGRAMRLIQENGAPATALLNPSLIKLLVKARRWWKILREGELDIKTFAAREKVHDAYLTRVLRLAFLSPAVVDAILAGRQSPTATVTELTLGARVDPDWAVQRQHLIA